MTEYINVTVQTTQPRKISVKPSTVAPNLQITVDPTQQNAKISRDWAIGEGLIQNEDYSSKTWAAESKRSADLSKMYSEAASLDYNNLSDSINQYNEQISGVVADGLENINTSVADGINTIETASDETIEEILSVSDKIINRVGFELFDTKLSDHILTYEETKGWALQGTYVYSTAIAGERYGYPDFIAKCIEEKEAGTATSVTLGSSTITMYVNSNGHQFYDIADKGVVDNWFNTYGIADFYGVDIENECVFLPRNNYFMQLTGDTSKVNKFNEAGLPTHTHTRGTMNIWGQFAVPGGGWYAGGHQAGAFTLGDSGMANCKSSGDHDSALVDFNASRNWTGETSAPNNAIYGKSNTVQPPSSNKLLYYCVGNTVTDTSWIDAVTQVEAGVKDLEDKKNLCIEEIEEIAKNYDSLTKRQITNCITEIPQRIKYTLENGTLTIKAGSVVIVPYGTTDRTSEFPVGATFLNDNFKVYDTQFADGKFFVWAESVEDVLHITQGTATEAGVEFICLTTNSGTDWGTSGCGSGTTARTDSGYQYYTNTNFVKKHTSGVANAEVYSLPIMLTTKEDGVPTSIDQVFNGMGYIGSTVWVDKGVKGLIPNGRNEDGSLNNIEFVTNKVSTYSIVGFTDLNTVIAGVEMISNDIHIAAKSYYLGEHYVHPTPEQYSSYYNNAQNKWYYCQSGTTWIEMSYCSIGNLKLSRTNNISTVSSFNPKQPFRVVDYSDKSWVAQQSFPSNRAYSYPIGASGAGYIAQDTGEIYVKATSTSSTAWVQIGSSGHSRMDICWVTAQNNTGVVSLQITKREQFFVSAYNMNITSIQLIYAQGVL